jgi:hypothetical protein
MTASHSSQHADRPVLTAVPLQRAEGDDRRRLVRAGLLEAPRLARDRVDARMDVDPIGAARQPL